MNKYPIDKELKKRRNIIPPVNPFILPFANFFLKNIKKPFDKKKVDIKYLKVGNVKIHLITPLNIKDQPSPLLFYIHGGGLIFHAAPGHFKGEQAFALSSNIRVVGIEYSLSPKHKYPVALNQCVEVYNYLVNNHKELNIDINKIAIGGDSASGLLALETYLEVKKEDIKAPIGLMLIYPVIDNKMNTLSMERYNDTPCWNNKLNKKMWDYYLDDNQNYVSIMDRIDEFDIENIYIELTEYDCLHDEGYNFYLALKDKVKNMVFYDTKGTFHGYDVNFKAKICIETFLAKVDYLNKLFN